MPKPEGLDVIRMILTALAALALTAASPAPAPAELVRPIASFTVTLMPPGKGQQPFGWIELIDSAGKDSGFIYLEDSDDDPHLGGSGTYIVTHLPYRELGPMIDLLQRVKPLQIRFFDAGGRPSVFIESSAKSSGLDETTLMKSRKAL